MAKEQAAFVSLTLPTTSIELSSDGYAGVKCFTRGIPKGNVKNNGWNSTIFGISNRVHEHKTGVRSEIRGFHNDIKRIPEAVTICVLNQCEVKWAIPLTEQRMKGSAYILCEEIRAMR